MFRPGTLMFRSFLVFFCLSFTCLLAQQDPQITHNMFNKFMYNPAVAGAYPELHATLLHRSQWVGIDGAPSTSNLNAHAYVGEIKVKWMTMRKSMWMIKSKRFYLVLVLEAKLVF